MLSRIPREDPCKKGETALRHSVSPSQVSNRAVVHLCVVTFRQSQSSCSDKEDRAEHQVMLARQALFASLQRVRMKATTLYMPNNMTCFVLVICRHSTIEQSSCSNEEHRAAQVEAQSPRDQSHHSEREVILHQGSRLPKRDHPVPWTFFKTGTAATPTAPGQPRPARTSEVLKSRKTIRALRMDANPTSGTSQTPSTKESRSPTEDKVFASLCSDTDRSMAHVCIIKATTHGKVAPSPREE